jgi:hypothetical protein
MGSKGSLAKGALKGTLVLLIRNPPPPLGGPSPLGGPPPLRGLLPLGGPPPPLKVHSHEEDYHRLS